MLVLEGIDCRVIFARNQWRGDKRANGIDGIDHTQGIQGRDQAVVVDVGKLGDFSFAEGRV